MSEKHKTYPRFSLPQRIEHLILILSFTLLAVTGLPQKYPLSPVSQATVSIFGNVEILRVVHHVSAIVFMLQGIYHFVVVAYKLFVRRTPASMVPSIKDGKDAFDAVRYNLGFKKTAPKMPRFNFTEKVEYWAMIWGGVVMALTGLILWNPIAVTRVLPGDFVPAAKAAHGAEAVLAVLAIIIWHFWNVHARSFNKSMFTGRMSRHEMEEEHGHELEQIEAGRVYTPPPAEVQRQRMKIFLPVAAVTSLALAAAVIYLVTFEQSSLTTLPPAQRAAVVVTQTPTAAAPSDEQQAPAPAEPEAADDSTALAWTGRIGPLFGLRCSTCHGDAGGFTAEDYASVMEGIEPGSPDASAVVQVQRQNHPVLFSEEQLADVVAWIEAGAPETPGGAAAQPGGEAELTWGGQVEDLFAAKCAGCHGTMGGYSAETYEDAMQGVEPGSPDDSEVVVVQQAGHPGMFSAEELQTVIDWIQAGAPQ